MKKMLLLLVVLTLTVTALPTRSASALASWPVISKGQSGPHVKTIQYLLFSRGYPVGLDGAFGPQTEGYVKQFQSSQGLYPDGVVGSATWSKLVVQVDYSLATQSSAVAALETQMNRHGYSMKPDFTYGAATRYAVLDFKSKHYLGGGSTVGVTTWQEIVGSNTIDKTSSSYYLTNSQGEARLAGAGISWTSSGSCSDRNIKTCTSFDGMLSGSIDGLIHFKQQSGCPIKVTGGTEVGHNETYDYPYTHSNGHKIDISSHDRNIFGTYENCATKYIKANFTYLGKRTDLDQAELYVNSRGDLYALEPDHWDIAYYSRN